MTDDRQSLPVGTIVADHFRILEPARGRGSFGLTYRAADPNGGVVALKEYFPRDEARRGPDGLTLQFRGGGHGLDHGSFDKEITALARCPQHPGIAQFIKADVANNTGYLALEWIEGSDLTALANRSDAVLTALFLQLLDALLHLSEVHLAHRDIKPANIMLRPDGSAVLVDLGAARLVSGGATLAPKTLMLTPGYAAPEQFSEEGHQGLWTDLFGLSATFYNLLTGVPAVADTADKYTFGELAKPLRLLQLDGDQRLTGRDHRLLDAIDLALRADAAQRPAGPRRYLEAFALTGDELERWLPPAYMSVSLLQRPDKPMHVPMAPPATNVSPSKPGANDYQFKRFQTAIIQSLDSARFHDSAFLTSEGFKQDNTLEQKVALAKTELFLNLMFGREVVIPAGHIADSKAVFQILKQALPIYMDDYQARIDAACEAQAMPRFRPFKLAIDDPRNTQGYRGFVETYRYTGAPLPLLQAAGRADGWDYEQAKKEGVETVRRLFLARDYNALEATVREPGYAQYAARVDRYFAHDTSQFAADRRPIEALTSYSEVFIRHLDNDWVSGAGVSEAKASLDVVAQAKSDFLRLIEKGEEDVTGFRGNWYIYGEQFRDVWPLARGYLDAKLYLSMADKYRIDHPVLVSQALEYGKFDHSLVLGPRFGEAMVEQPKLDAGLTQLSETAGEALPWEALFEAFLDEAFLNSLRFMSRAYDAGNIPEYKYMVRQHAYLLCDLITSLRVDVKRGEIMLAASASPKDGVQLSSYESQIEAGTRAAEFLDSGASIFPPYGAGGFDGASTHILPFQNGLKQIGRGDPALIHYFIKPLRLKAWLAG